MAATSTFYVGTSTKPNGSKGIYRYALDTDTGAVTDGGLVAETKNPTFLACHPNGKFIYAVNETDTDSTVSAFEITAKGELQFLNQQSSAGAGPCHVSVDAEGKNAFVANYLGGNVAVLPIEENGSLRAPSGFVNHTGSSVNPERQKEPHAHSIYSVANRIYACDLGVDKVFLYALSADGQLKAGEPPFIAVTPGSGPRHLAFLGNYTYVINELSSTITVFKEDSNQFSEVQTISTLPAGFTGKNTTAEIAMNPQGTFLYASNRGHDSIAVFKIGADRKLTLIDHTPSGGKGPRNFAIDPTGKWCIAANQASGNFCVFKVDQGTGKLTATGQTLAIGAPMCVLFPGPRLALKP